MLGRDAVDQRHRLVPIADHDDRAMRVPAAARDRGARQGGEVAFDRLRHLRGEFGVVGDEDRLRGEVVLGLRQEVGGDPCGVVAAIGHHQDLRRAGDHVDADPAEDPALGRRDIGVAGPDDLVDRRDRRGAVGQRRDRLRAADPVDFVDPAQARRRQHQRVEHPVRRRHHHHQPLDPGDLGRDRVHQHRGRVGGGAARHVKPGARQRSPAHAEPHAAGIDVVDTLRQLLPVEALDPLGGEAQRRHRLLPAPWPRCRRSRPPTGAAAPAISAHAVEALGVVDQRRVAARRGRRR